MKLFAFELKKMVMNRKFFILMLFIIAGVALLFGRNVVLEDQAVSEERQEIQSLMQSAQGNARVHQLILETYPDDEEEAFREELNNEIRERLDGMLEAQLAGDWQQQLTLEIEMLELVIQYREEEGEFPLTDEQIQYTLKYNDILLSEGIPPEYENYSTALPNFMMQVMNLYLLLGAIMIMALLIAETLTSEFETRSINLLYTQPLKRPQIITSKFWSSVLLYVCTTAVLFLTAGAGGFLFGSEGTFSYPVIIERDFELVSITVSEYLIQGMTVLSVTLVMIIALYLWYSLFFRQTLPALFALAGTLLAGYAVTTAITWPSFAWFNPFRYVLPQPAILVQNEQVWYQGLPMTALFTTLFFAAACQKIKTSAND